MDAQLSLAPSFVRQLRKDGFKRIGHYEIQRGNIFKIDLTDEEAGNWTFSVYTFVSYVDGGRHVRIGSFRGPLRRRLNEWQRLVTEALNITMPKNQKFKGRTPPWEAQGWTEHRRGLLFALRTKVEGLRHREKKLQRSYDPSLCNDTAAGRNRKKVWISEYGKPTDLTGSRSKSSKLANKPPAL